MVTSASTADIQEPAPDAQVPQEHTAPADPNDGAESGRQSRRRFRYTLPGAWVAVAFACLSFTPSLVPRPGAYQGVVCGIGAAIGYGLGVLGARVWRDFADRPARPTRPRSWRAFLIAAPIIVLVCYLLGQRWQGQIRDLMNAEPESFGSKLMLPVVAALLFVGLVAAARGIRHFFWWVARLLSRWMGPRPARALGWVVAAALTVGLLSGVLVDGILAVTDRIFAVKDTGTSDDSVQPTT